MKVVPMIKPFIIAASILAVLVFRVATLPWNSLQFVAKKTAEFSEANHVGNEVVRLVTNQVTTGPFNQSVMLHNYQKTGYAIATIVGLSALTAEISIKCECSPGEFSKERADLLKEFFSVGLSHAKPDEALILYSYALNPETQLSFSPADLEAFKLQGEAILNSKDSIYHHMNILNDSLFGLFWGLKVPTIYYPTQAEQA
jgi:hypothetical protein